MRSSGELQPHLVPSSYATHRGPSAESLPMCGIAGVLLRRGRPDGSALRRMGDAMAHRGPDDQGVHVAGPLGLLQTRLSIIDLEGGRQPMVDGSLTLVANGEIYNFVELRRALEARGRRFATRSDSETILHAYALDGPAALPSLNGMFAFALYDAGRRELVLGRDRLGIKPLYYAELPDRVVFASELKAILAVWPGEPALDPGALTQYLESRFNTGDQSLVCGIHRLPPGTALVVDADLNLQLRRYWSLLDVRPRRLDFGGADGEFEPLFHQVMVEHLRADVPCGLFLSSGVDSGVLLTAMSELTGRCAPSPSAIAMPAPATSCPRLRRSRAASAPITPRSSSIATPCSAGCRTPSGPPTIFCTTTPACRRRSWPSPPRAG